MAECPEVATASQGKTIEESISNLRDATELYREEFLLVNGNSCFLTTFETTCG